MALGAKQISPLSSAERALCEAASPRHLSQAEVRDLRDGILEGFDPLGDAFCRLRPRAERRQDGATYTPAPVVRAMVAWAKQGSEIHRVVDPGSGSARFGVAAGLAFPRAEVLAIELDPLAALISRANFAVWGMEKRARVIVKDYRAFSPQKLQGRTLYIGNPPYIRHHRISSEWKLWLSSTARSLNLRASQLAGMHVHFFLATVTAAQRGDRGVFITSSEWLDVNYGGLLRELLLDGLGGSAIHVIAPEVEPFEDAQTTGAITCFEIGSKPSSVRLRRVKRVADLGRLDGGQAIRRERLKEAQRWTPLLRVARKVPAGYVELGEICRVHRGAVTGANRVWVVDPSRAQLPESVLFRAVTRARELFTAGASLATSESLRAVVDLPADLDELDWEHRVPVERFLRNARRLGVHEGYIARHRRAWWSVGLRDPAPILATYMARRAPAIVRNLAAARHINIAHGLYPREPIPEAVLNRLAAAVRDCINVGHGRTYAGGLTKFEPREMERLLIPDVMQSA